MRYLFRALTAAVCVAKGASDMQEQRMEMPLGDWVREHTTEILSTLPTWWEGGQVSSP